MVMPDGSIKEGFFNNNIFYGDNSPMVSEKSHVVLTPSEGKVLMKNYSA